MTDNITLDLGQCTSIAPIKDDADNDIRCIVELFHKGSHFGPENSFPDREQSQVRWDDIIVLQKTKTDDLYAECSCSWTDGPGKKIIELGINAVQHNRETGHVLRGLPNA